MTTTNQLEVSAIKFNGYRIELCENRQGLPAARYQRLLTAGKNKGQYKQIEAFAFRTIQERINYIAKVMQNVTNRKNEAEQKKSALVAARQENNHPFTIGQVLYDSWGYDQTNIDFYMITEIKGKQVILQAIGSQKVEGSGYHDSCNVKPCKEAVKGQPFKKLIQVSIYSAKATYYINGYRGSLHVYDKGEKGVYCSWGY